MIGQRRRDAESRNLFSDRWRMAGFLLLAAGLTGLLAGVFYDVVVVNIPYQDPPPEMAVAYARKSSRALVIYRFGAGIAVVGGVVLAVRGRLHRRG